MKFKNPKDLSRKQKYYSKIPFKIGKEGKALDKKELSVENKISNYFLKNDKGSTQAIAPHLTENKEFNKSMKNINERAFKT